MIHATAHASAATRGSGARFSEPMFVFVKEKGCQRTGGAGKGLAPLHL